MKYLPLIAAACVATACGDDSGNADGGASETEGEDTTGGTDDMQPTATLPFEPDSSGGGSGGGETGGTVGDDDDDDDDDDDNTSTAGDDDDDDDNTSTAGDDDDDDTTAGDPTLVELEIEPVEPMLVLALGESGEVPLTVTGIYDDDSTEDVTDLVEAWTLSNPDLGDVVDATFGTDGFDAPTADVTIATAELEGLEASTQITVVAVPVPDELVITPFEDDDVHDSAVELGSDADALDLFLNVDTTGSMSAPIAAIEAGLGNAVATVEGRFADVAVGIGNFEDFPIDPFGATVCFNDNQPDQPFELLTAVTTDDDEIANAVAALTNDMSAPVGCGADLPESQMEALYQIATGDGIMGPAPTFVEPGPEGIGGVAFREGSIPVVTTITDAISHPADFDCFAPSYPMEPSLDGVFHDQDATYDALGTICAKTTSLISGNLAEGDCVPRADATALALATGSRVWPEAWDFAPGGRPANCLDDECCTDVNLEGRDPDADGRCELVYLLDFGGADAEAATADGALMAATFVPLPSVTLTFDGSDVDAQGDPLPGGVTSDQLVIGFEADSNEPGPLASAPDPIADLNDFLEVVPGTDLTWTLEVDNDVIPDTDSPTLVSVDINDTDGCRVIDTATLWIVVPPTPL